MPGRQACQDQIASPGISKLRSLWDFVKMKLELIASPYRDIPRIPDAL
jgi:hypothetical protein